jgi:hypothetical protein
MISRTLESDSIETVKANRRPASPGSNSHFGVGASWISLSRHLLLLQPAGPLGLLTDSGRERVQPRNHRLTVKHAPGCLAQVSNMIIARNRHHPKQRLAVRATMAVPVRQMSLMGQERRALHAVPKTK